MQGGPEAVVPAAPLLPPPLGLLQTAQVIEHEVGAVGPVGFQPTNDRWLAGIRWAIPSGSIVGLLDACNPALALDNAYSGSPAGAYYPFGVIAEDQCLAASFGTEEFRARARQALIAQESNAVERQFERGLVGNSVNPRLAQATTGHIYLGSSANTQATQLALTPKDALACLDEGIARWGKGQGMIHAPSYVIAQWVASRSIVVENFDLATTPADPSPSSAKSRLIFSPNGNPIVAGSGYLGVSPDGTVVPDLTTGGHAAMWCYATGMVTVHRDAEVSYLPDSPSEVGQALDRTNNTITWRAWRAYAFAWSRLLHASVKVNTVLAAAP
jgi:hypothetical protein